MAEIDGRLWTLLSRETEQAVESAQLVAPMLARFMATDRAFAKARRAPALQGNHGGVEPASLVVVVGSMGTILE